jgi:L-fucose isomerase
MEKMLRFAKGAVAVGWMKNKAYVNLGGVSMGIMGSYCDVIRAPALFRHPC